MKFDILRVIETTHPLKIIFIGIFILSVGLNFLQHSRNKKLVDILNSTHKTKIILVPKNQPYEIPNIEQPKEFFTSINKGV